MELARLKHRDYEAEAARARLAAQVERSPGERLAVIKSAISGLRSALPRRRLDIVHKPRLEPTG
jgi:hypothetical protein